MWCRCDFGVACVQDIVVDSTVDEHTKMACAEALTFLSTCPSGQESILKQGVIMCLTLACRASNGKSKALYWSAVLLCNLTTQPALHETLLKQPLLAALSAISSSFDRVTVEAAARSLFNISTTTAGCLALCGNRTLAKTMRNLSVSKDQSAKRWLAIVLANASVLPRCQVALMDLNTVRLISEYVCAVLPRLRLCLPRFICVQQPDRG